MDITVIATFLTKLSEFRVGLNLIFLCKMPNVKHGSTKCNSNFKWQTGGK